MAARLNKQVPVFGFGRESNLMDENIEMIHKLGSIFGFNGKILASASWANFSIY